MQQYYFNDRDVFIEAVFYFPISSSKVFIDFEVMFENKSIKGEIDEK